MPSCCGLIVANGSQVGFGPLAKLVGATVVAIATANLLMLTLSEHLVAAVVPLLDVLSGVSRHPVAELVDEDLHHYPHSVDQQFQGGRHHGRPSTSSNRSLLTVDRPYVGGRERLLD